MYGITSQELYIQVGLDHDKSVMIVVISRMINCILNLLGNEHKY
jgi:hypothetical protein